MINRIDFISGLSCGEDQLKVFINNNYEIIYFLYDFAANGDYKIDVVNYSGNTLTVKLSNSNSIHIESVAKFLKEFNGKSCGKKIIIDIIEQTASYIIIKCGTL